MPQPPKNHESERDSRLRENYKKNETYAKKGDYQTQLNPASEEKFRGWLRANKVPFDPNSKVSDYDMRGFWLALQSNDPRAISATNPNDKRLHYPDFWKTPYHQSFSSESQWAKPGAPSWNKSDQLVLPNGKVVFDERAPLKARSAPPPVKTLNGFPLSDAWIKMEKKFKGKSQGDPDEFPDPTDTDSYGWRMHGDPTE